MLVENIWINGGERILIVRFWGHEWLEYYMNFRTFQSQNSVYKYSKYVFFPQKLATFTWKYTFENENKLTLKQKFWKWNAQKSINSWTLANKIQNYLKHFF